MNLEYQCPVFEQNRAGEFYVDEAKADPAIFSVSSIGVVALMYS